MTRRVVVIAAQGFAAGDLDPLVGKHPAVIAPGVIRQGTELWSDDPIVRAHPALFVDADIVPGPSAEASSKRSTDPAPTSGPRPMVAAEEVEAMRQKLEADDMPSGERSIAKALGVSRDAVRYALGKDHD